MTSNEKNTLALNWPEAGQFRRSIRLEFSLYISGLIIVLMAVTGYVITNQYAKTVTRSVVDKELVQARAYSGPAGKHIIASEEPDALMLSNICRKLQSENTDIYWAGITGQDGRFIAHTDIKQVVSGGSLFEHSGSEYLDLLQPGESFALEHDTLYISVPIQEAGLVLGELGLAASVQQIAAARRLSIITVASITVLMILIGIPITTIIMNRKLRPIRTITDTLMNVDTENIAFDIPIKTRNEFGFLSETLRVMGDRLNLARREAIETERITRELEIAREIQHNILPTGFPRTAFFEFAGFYESAREVGGDYYDFLDFEDGQFAFLVADVSGKSLPGMLVMLLTRDIIRRLGRTLRRPEELLKAVNAELLGSIKKGMFVTMFYGLLDSRTGMFRFASAGHNPLLVLRAGGVATERFNPRGYPLGMMPVNIFDARIESGEIQLEPGDCLIQYTDGINEAHNTVDEEFGMERFVASISSRYELSTNELVEGIRTDHRAFVAGADQYDDITLLTMKWIGRTADTPIKEVPGISYAE
jgi:serine phosphatase RsbU (regulator of sigma subunit)/uncharacterized protein (UPF0333 family)